jgi:hypothetical protein
MIMTHARCTAAIALLVGLVPRAAVHAQEGVAGHVELHGYLTQGYGMSRGGLVLGLDSQGTLDYRRAAILARYTINPSDRFVLQIANRRLGDSPAMQFETDVKLDAAYYQHRFADGVVVRIGKMPQPFGIFNDIRYAGTLVPFFRAPFSVYSEGTHTSENIDGAVASKVFFSDAPWSLSTDVFGGSLHFLEFGTVFDPATRALQYRGAPMESGNAFGTQLWLSTPIDGLRLGATGERHWDEGGVFPRPNGELATDWLGSIDGNFEHVQARSEFMYHKTDGFQTRSRYALFGVRPVTWIAVNGQADFMDATIGDAPFAGKTVPTVRDFAGGINIFFDELTVFKAELHKTKGFNLEQATNMLGAPLKGSYFISSFSVSF